MRYGYVPGISKPISRLVQGTASLDVGKEQESFELLDLALANGYNAIDTAHVYGNARERMIGRWIASGSGVREKLVILAKGAHHDRERRRVTPADIAADLHASLDRLGTDYVDLYVLHRDDDTVPVGPIVEALNEHKAAGRIHAFGGSNWSHERIRAANDYADAHGLTRFAVSSPNFSLAEQVEEPWENCISISGPRGAAAREFYAHLGDKIALFTWSSLAGGFWSGRFTRENFEGLAGAGYSENLCVKCYCYDQNFQRMDRAKELAAERGCSVAEVALAYVMCQPMNIFALVFCANEEQFVSNNRALDLDLTDKELAWLDLRAESKA